MSKNIFGAFKNTLGGEAQQASSVKNEVSILNEESDSEEVVSTTARAKQFFNNLKSAQTNDVYSQAFKDSVQDLKKPPILPEQKMIYAVKGKKNKRIIGFENGDYAIKVTKEKDENGNSIPGSGNIFSFFTKDNYGNFQLAQPTEGQMAVFANIYGVSEVYREKIAELGGQKQSANSTNNAEIAVTSVVVENETTSQQNLKIEKSESKSFDDSISNNQTILGKNTLGNKVVSGVPFQSSLTLKRQKQKEEQKETQETTTVMTASERIAALNKNSKIAENRITRAADSKEKNNPIQQRQLKKGGEKSDDVTTSVIAPTHETAQNTPQRKVNVAFQASKTTTQSSKPIIQQRTVVTKDSSSNQGTEKEEDKKKTAQAKTPQRNVDVTPKPEIFHNRLRPQNSTSVDVPKNNSSNQVAKEEEDKTSDFITPQKKFTGIGSKLQPKNPVGLMVSDSSDVSNQTPKRTNFVKKGSNITDEPGRNVEDNVTRRKLQTSVTIPLKTPTTKSRTNVNDSNVSVEGKGSTVVKKKLEQKPSEIVSENQSDAKSSNYEKVTNPFSFVESDVPFEEDRNEVKNVKKSVDEVVEKKEIKEDPNISNNNNVLSSADSGLENFSQGEKNSHNSTAAVAPTIINQTQEDQSGNPFENIIGNLDLSPIKENSEEDIDLDIEGDIDLDEDDERKSPTLDLKQSPLKESLTSEEQEVDEKKLEQVKESEQVSEEVNNNILSTPILNTPVVSAKGEESNFSNQELKERNVEVINPPISQETPKQNMEGKKLVFSPEDNQDNEVEKNDNSELEDSSSEEEEAEEKKENQVKEIAIGISPPKRDGVLKFTPRRASVGDKNQNVTVRGMTNDEEVEKDDNQHNQSNVTLRDGKRNSDEEENNDEMSHVTVRSKRSPKVENFTIVQEQVVQENYTTPVQEKKMSPSPVVSTPTLHPVCGVEPRKIECGGAGIWADTNFIFHYDNKELKTEGEIRELAFDSLVSIIDKVTLDLQKNPKYNEISYENGIRIEKPRRLKMKDVIELIDYAQEKGGISKVLNKGEDKEQNPFVINKDFYHWNAKKNDWSINGKDAWKVKFSTEFQKLCEEKGFHTDEECKVPLKLTRFPPEARVKLKARGDEYEPIENEAKVRRSISGVNTSPKRLSLTPQKKDNQHR